MSIVKESVEMKSALVWRLTRACRHRVEEMSNEVLIKYSDRQSSSQSFGKAVIESRDAYQRFRFGASMKILGTNGNFLTGSTRSVSTSLDHADASELSLVTSSNSSSIHQSINSESMSSLRLIDTFYYFCQRFQYHRVVYVFQYVDGASYFRSWCQFITTY